VTRRTLRFVDESRARVLATTVYVPGRVDGPLPLIVFGHGFTGHPRKFTKLLGRWADAGYVVAAPAFPHTNDEAPDGVVFDDVVNQPADVRFVIDELLGSTELGGHVDPTRIGVAGFSLGGMTALAVGFNPRYRDPRLRAIAVISGRFGEELGGAHELETKPLLVVHGTDDSVVPFHTGDQVYRAAQAPKVLVALEGGRHHEDVEDEWGPLPAVVETTVAFWDLFLCDEAAARARLLADRPGVVVRSDGV
jgi:dienelactone hydrolase